MVLDSVTVPIEDAATVARRLQISMVYIDSPEGSEEDAENAGERIEKCAAETDLETLETTLDGRRFRAEPGSAQAGACAEGTFGDVPEPGRCSDPKGRRAIEP
jgi:hypothetical protein